MSKSNASIDQLLNLFYLNTAIPNIGDTSGLQPSATAGSFYIALHTADPLVGGSQSTSEATYTGYARVAVARSGAGWTLTSHVISNTAAVTFANCTAGSDTLTHFSIGVASSGAGVVIQKGALTAPLNVSAGITPAFSAGALTTSES